MSGTRLVYGDGLDDLKDCFSGTFGFVSRGSAGGIGRGGSSGSTRSSRTRVYGGDHYVHPHHLRESHQSQYSNCCNEGCNIESFLSTSKSTMGMTLAFLWLIILTIVCIVLGSNMGNLILTLFKSSVVLSKNSNFFIKFWHKKTVKNCRDSTVLNVPFSY